MQARKIATILATFALIAGPAEAQRIGAPYPVPPANGPLAQAPLPALPAPSQALPAQPQALPAPPQAFPAQPRALPSAPVQGWQSAGGGWQQQRWQAGRWEAGTRAPGGWRGYRRMERGARLPGYWTAPDFVIVNWQGYGLPVPPRGYSWSRYYDDAVLIDASGQVYDSVSGLDWNAYGYSGDYSGSYANGARWQGTYQGQYIAPPAVSYQAPPPVIHQLPPQGYVQSYGAGAYASGVTVNGQFYPTAPGALTTITVTQAAPIVETRTVTEYVTEYRTVRAKRVVRRPVKRWHRPVCGCGCCR